MDKNIKVAVVGDLGCALKKVIEDRLKEEGVTVTSSIDRGISVKEKEDYVEFVDMPKPKETQYFDKPKSKYHK